MYVLEWRTVYALKWGLFWCLFLELCSNEGNKHQQLHSSERINSSSQEYIHYFISYTT